MTETIHIAEAIKLLVEHVQSLTFLITHFNISYMHLLFFFTLLIHLKYISINKDYR